MNRRAPPGFDADALDEIRFDRTKAAPPGARARVLARIGQTVAGLATGGLAASGTAHFMRSPRRASAIVRELASRPMWIAATAFTLGGLAGAGIHAEFSRTPAERIIYVDRFTELPSPPPASPSTALPTEASSAAVQPSSKPNPPRSTASGTGASPASGLTAERALLDRARRALQNGDYGDAERALDMHGARFPSGLLVEEREALAIKTLANSGRRAEALARANKFRERFPKSLFGPSVDEAVGNNP